MVACVWHKDDLCVLFGSLSSTHPFGGNSGRCGVWCRSKGCNVEGVYGSSMIIPRPSPMCSSFLLCSSCQRFLLRLMLRQLPAGFGWLCACSHPSSVGSLGQDIGWQCLWIYVCVCVWERERERERARQTAALSLTFWRERLSVFPDPSRVTFPFPPFQQRWGIWNKSWALVLNSLLCFVTFENSLWATQLALGSRKCWLNSLNTCASGVEAWGEKLG